MPSIFTVGHSARGLKELIKILKSFGIGRVVDVRTIPRSKHNPQFNKEMLPLELEKEGIKYLHMPGLGGFRKEREDSKNNGWRDSSFRGFADYMQTIEFEENLLQLYAVAQSEIAALMCAEAVPWRCHRSLIADALSLRGIKVMHILGLGKVYEHRVTPWAKVEGVKITYPASLGN
jgi:uncharacterized protein (DUF488 family)